MMKLVFIAVSCFAVGSFADIKQEVIDVHNKFRANVRPTASNMERMTWSEEGAKAATAWVSKCIYEHGGHSPCGQNLYASTNLADTFTDAITYWHDEVKDYTYGPFSRSPLPMVGHYTQIVWADTTTVACAKNICPQMENLPGTETWVYIACHYCDRRGNSVGAYPYKQGVPASECKSGQTAGSDGLCSAAISNKTQTATTASSTTPAPATTAEVDEGVDKEIQEIVDKHNALRANVRPPASNMEKMKWDDNAAEAAEAYIEGCEYHSGTFPSGCTHTTLGTTRLTTTASDVIGYWYSSGSAFIYGGPNEPGAGYDTYKTIVWATTSRVGCAMKECPASWTTRRWLFAACVYCPAGNAYSSDYPYKQGVPGSECKSGQTAGSDGLCA